MNKHPAAQNLNFLPEIFLAAGYLHGIASNVPRVLQIMASKFWVGRLKSGAVWVVTLLEISRE